MLYGLSLCVTGFTLSLTNDWREGLVVIGGAPSLIIAFVFIGIAMTVFSNQAQKVYAEAGAIAQEVFFFPSFLPSFPPLLHISFSSSLHFFRLWVLLKP